MSTPVRPKPVLSVHRLSNGYVVARDDTGWVSGVYATPEAARTAATHFSSEDLQALQNRLGENGVITVDLLAELQKARDEAARGVSPDGSGVRYRLHTIDRWEQDATLTFTLEDGKTFDFYFQFPSGGEPTLAQALTYLKQELAERERLLQRQISGDKVKS